MGDRRIGGIQWLRAVMSIFVVAWHMGGGGRSLIFSAQNFNRNVFTVSDFVNFHLLLLAVPTFMIISNYLLAVAGDDAAIVSRRAKRVAVLALFWPIMLTLFLGGWDSLVKGIPGSALDWLVYLLTAGHTIYYFFVSLLITYGVTFVANRASLTTNVVLLALSILTLGIAPLIAIHCDLQYPGLRYLCAYWSPINFVPYSFAGILVMRLFDDNIGTARVTLIIGLLFLVGCGLSYLEWMLFPNATFFYTESYAMPAYTRPSLVVFSMLLLIVALRVNLVPAIIDFMARYSLALYCLHIFLWVPTVLLLTKFGLGMPSLANIWIAILVTVVTSYLAAKLLSFVWKNRILF